MVTTDLLLGVYLKPNSLTHVFNPDYMTYKINDTLGAFVLALRCKHCGEFFSDQKNVSNISTDEACRECDLINQGIDGEIVVMPKDVSF